MSEERGSLGIVIGALDAPVVAFVGADGAIAMPDARIELGWSLYTDEWRSPLAASTRQHAIDGMPVVETRAAVPSGDVVHRGLTRSPGRRRRWSSTSRTRHRDRSRSRCACVVSVAT